MVAAFMQVGGIEREREREVEREREREEEKRAEIGPGDFGSAGGQGSWELGSVRGQCIIPHMHTHTRARTHARTHARTRTHTHQYQPTQSHHSLLAKHTSADTQKHIS